MKKVVIFTGAGISAESGISTFRASDGLWNNYKVIDVATPEAWKKNPALVQDFYNQRRRDVLNAQPNLAHTRLHDLESQYDVTIITQNIDDLHERGGSTNVVHLHGEITKSQSTANKNLVYDIKGDTLKIGELCEVGSQLRPHVVWFTEDVPNMPLAIKLVEEAEIFIVCGTSLNVYPAAGLIYYLKEDCIKYIVDLDTSTINETEFIKVEKKATEGIDEVVSALLTELVKS